MPKIPTYTADGRSPGVGRAANHPGYDNSNHAATLVGAANRTSDAMLAIQGEEERQIEIGRRETVAIIEKQREQYQDSESIKYAGLYDGMFKKAQADLLQDPTIYDDPLNYSNKLQLKAVEIGKELKAETPDKIVQGLIDNHINRQLPSQIAMAERDGLKLFTHNQLREYENNKEILSQRVAEASSAQERKALIDTFTAYTEKTARRTFMAPGDIEHNLHDFAVKSTAKHMDVLRLRDKNDGTTSLDDFIKSGGAKIVPETIQGQILSKQDTDRRLAETARNKAHQDADRDYRNQFFALLNSNLASEDQLNDIKMGRDPFIKASEYNHIVQLANAREHPDARRAVHALMTEFDLKKPSLGLVDDYRTRLNKLVPTLPGPTDLVDKFAQHLNTQANVMRNANTAEIAAGIKVAEDNYRATNVKPTIDLFPNKTRNQEVMDMAEIRNRIRKGEDGVKVMEDMRKRKKDKDDNRTPSVKQDDADVDALRSR